MSSEIQVKYDNQEVEKCYPLRPALPGDAGLDLVNATGHPVTILPGHSCIIPCGLSVKIPVGYVGFIKARSSTFAKKGLFVIDGVIDAGYTGPLYTQVWHPGLNNTKSHPITVQPWERVSQLIVTQFVNQVVQVKALPITERGAKGFGSTG